MLNKGALLAVTLLVLVLLVTSWYAASLTRITPFIESGSFNMGTLTDANILQTDNFGNPQYTGTMQSATEFNNGDIHFLGFNMTFFNNGTPVSPPWQLRSDSGTVTNQNTEITLNGHVNLSRAAANGTIPVLIATDSAIIYPNTQKITGTDLVTISQPGTINQTSGIGFIADIQSKRVQLLSKVQGTYAPD